MGTLRTADSGLPSSHRPEDLARSHRTQKKEKKKEEEEEDEKKKKKKEEEEEMMLMKKKKKKGDEEEEEEEGDEEEEACMSVFKSLACIDRGQTQDLPLSGQKPLLTLPWGWLLHDMKVGKLC